MAALAPAGALRARWPRLRTRSRGARADPARRARARAVPFGTLLALFMLWFGISVPLVFVGSYFGYKKPAPDDPVRTNKIPRQIPEQARPRRARPRPAGRRRSV